VDACPTCGNDDVIFGEDGPSHASFALCRPCGWVVWSDETPGADGGESLVMSHCSECGEDLGMVVEDDPWLDDSICADCAWG
jgi:hypothetical protein